MRMINRRKAGVLSRAEQRDATRSIPLVIISGALQSVLALHILIDHPSGAPAFLFNSFRPSVLLPLAQPVHGSGVKFGGGTAASQSGSIYAIGCMSPCLIE